MSQPTETTLTTRDPNLPAAGVWQIDTSHSVVGFVGRHLMVSKVRGRFTDFTGEVIVAEVPEQSSVEVHISTASVDSGSQQRDDHLRSGDLFDVASYPEMVFRSTGVRGAGDDWQVDGELTIKGVTRPVTLDAEFHGVTQSPWNDERAGFSARTDIDREQWGLTWNMALEAGGVVVSKKIAIEIEVELVRAAAAS